MKIRYATTIEIDESKYPNLKQSTIRDYVKNTLDSIVSAIENEGHELSYLEDLNIQESK